MEKPVAQDIDSVNNITRNQTNFHLNDNTELETARQDPHQI